MALRQTALVLLPWRPWVLAVRWAPFGTLCLGKGALWAWHGRLPSCTRSFPAALS